MGIAGLHEFVSSAVRMVHLSDYEGEQLAVDGSSWLHRGAFTCGLEIEVKSLRRCNALLQSLNKCASPCLAITRHSPPRVMPGHTSLCLVVHR